ncbi:MAG: hypothetical protein IT563_15705 [Alphaproteobacteria bacterium]|nr:hypothetical protein [Alphaproteobacteria bacterium]
MIRDLRLGRSREDAAALSPALAGTPGPSDAFWRTDAGGNPRMSFGWAMLFWIVAALATVLAFDGLLALQ